MEDSSIKFQNFLTNDELEEIAGAVKSSPKGKLLINCLYLLSGNGHYRGASSVARAAEIVNAELHERKLLSESEQIVPKLIYFPSLISGPSARFFEWGARDLYETLSKMLFFQYSWNDASREMAESSRLDALSFFTRKLMEASKLKSPLEGVILSFHFAPGDVFSKYPEYSNRFAIVPLDDLVYPSFVRKETQNYFAGSERCKDDIIRALSSDGIPSANASFRVKVTGQPVNPDSIRGAPWIEGNEDKKKEDSQDKPKRYLIAMGGAGAQLPEMKKLLSSFSKYPGKRPEIVFYVGHHQDAAKELEKLSGPEGTIISKNSNRLEAIDKLSSEIRKCDAFITKPSELAFYPAPIYSLPPIGYHESRNLATIISEKRGRVIHSLWKGEMIPLDPLEEILNYEDGLEKLSKGALLKNPNTPGAFRMVREACKIAPAQTKEK